MFRKISRNFQSNFHAIFEKFHKIFKRFSGDFQEIFMNSWKKFHSVFKKILHNVYLWFSYIYSWSITQNFMLFCFVFCHSMQEQIGNCWFRVFTRNYLSSLLNIYLCNRVTMKDVSRPGRPRDLFNDDTIGASMHSLGQGPSIYCYRHSPRDGACFLNDASCSTVYRMLTEALKMKKVCTRWVPRELSNVQRSCCMTLALELLKWYECEGLDFLNCIVTRDVCWFHYWTPLPQNARKNHEYGKQWRKRRLASLKNSSLRERFSAPCFGTIKEWSWLNTVHQVEQWLQTRISTHWCVSDRRLRRRDAGYCWKT